MVVEIIETPVVGDFGIGAGDARSSQSLALRKTCADNGYRM